MMAIDYISPDGLKNTSITLVNEENRPTPQLVGLVAAELALDVAVAYGVYRLIRFITK